MARITVEDCLDKLDNRFQLVLVATRRARHVANGAEPRLPWDDDKPTVLALREVAGGVVDTSVMDEAVTPEVSEEAAEEVPQAMAELETLGDAEDEAEVTAEQAEEPLGEETPSQAQDEDL